MDKNSFREIEELQERAGTRVIDAQGSRFTPIRSSGQFCSAQINGERSDFFKGTLKWDQMSENWKAHLLSDPAKYWWFHPDVQPDKDPLLYQIREKLLSFAGEAVCLPDYDSDAEYIVQFGQFWLGYGAIPKMGEPNACHSNSALLWNSNRIEYKVCTGYALSADGMWRQHSWCIALGARMNEIIETTVERIAYYGFVMPDWMAETFLELNC